jgi:peptidoglycan hydrolase CwlO-like protein
MAVKREIKAVEEQLQAAQDEFNAVSEKLRQVSQQRTNMEEELMNSNVRLKQLLGELKAQKERAVENSQAVGADSSMTLAELSRKVV